MTSPLLCTCPARVHTSQHLHACIRVTRAATTPTVLLPLLCDVSSLVLPCLSSTCRHFLHLHARDCYNQHFHAFSCTRRCKAPLPHCGSTGCALCQQQRAHSTVAHCLKVCLAQPIPQGLVLRFLHSRFLHAAGCRRTLPTCCRRRCSCCLAQGWRHRRSRWRPAPAPVCVTFVCGCCAVLCCRTPCACCCTMAGLQRHQRWPVRHAAIGACLCPCLQPVLGGLQACRAARALTSWPCRWAAQRCLQGAPGAGPGSGAAASDAGGASPAQPLEFLQQQRRQAAGGLAPRGRLRQHLRGCCTPAVLLLCRHRGGVVPFGPGTACAVAADRARRLCCLQLLLLLLAQCSYSLHAPGRAAHAGRLCLVFSLVTWQRWLRRRVRHTQQTAGRRGAVSAAALRRRPRRHLVTAAAAQLHTRAGPWLCGVRSTPRCVDRCRQPGRQGRAGWAWLLPQMACCRRLQAWRAVVLVLLPRVRLVVLRLACGRRRRRAPSLGSNKEQALHHVRQQAAVLLHRNC